MSSNPVVLITGGGRGIGAATAKLFAKHGYDVCINYKSDQASAEQVAQQLKSLGVNSYLLQADIADEQQVIAMFAKLDGLVARLDVLVNNAAMMMPQMPLLEMDAKRINAILSCNVTGAFLCAREAIKRMDKGSIVNVSSGASRTGSPNEYLDYAASKGALDTFTIGLAKEVASKGIRVNAVRPGLIYTDMHRDGGEANRVDRLKSKLPLGRGGEADEVASAIYFLASEQASFTTGSFIDVSGGL
ncbi:SDR family oxidoreductase [Pseudoalteromonas sp. MEBiC 03607]|jgi:NAD(P)-dependent dehydrogenase (short-subunit alcohol dehydrogenase family)|uniref:SDR family oxidoreductase n=1 Tax=Pseudoalteromonas TaxID=53246 RepID=UPI000EED4CA1|nr:MULTISPECIES: SDR family oxidoreductase [unclassified Pseudoalteromonas]MCF2918889.1 SDR family oxidoreductase [Pseudoalteromonas sp. APAL1]TGV19964.1 SDR family oxidoreductase [Pseudoalteromonas sp. MEBiC 03607]HCV02855.1 NAD(P)-dependent oxidoreductase [Pseudoalteromonas sp.]|tara:strand:+ start:385 stop:1119 length:735 start_codon:yes stop_codon:yes gene_type:complete